MSCCCSKPQVAASDAKEVDDLPDPTEADNAHPDNKAIVAEPDFGGPCKKRRCTDCLCVLLLIAVWVVMTVIGLVCIPNSGFDSEKLHKGNPYRLINGMDYKGQICGISKDVKDLGNLYYLPSGEGVCIKKCPKSTDLQTYICKYNVQDELDLIEAEFGTLAVVTHVLSEGYVSDGVCAVQYKTKDTYTPGYCLSQDALNYGEELAKSEYAYIDDATKGLNTTSYEENSDQTWYDKIWSDLFNAWPYIVGVGIGGAIVIGFLYTFLLRIPGVLAVIIWGMLAAIFGLFVLAGAFATATGVRWKTDSERTAMQAQGMVYIGYALYAIAALWLCLICCLRRRIMLAIGIVKEAAKAIARMPVLIVFPLVQILGLLCFLVPWFIYCLFLGSSGELKVRDGGAAGDYREMQYDKNTYYAAWYMLFCYFWTSEFIVAMGQLIVAMAVSTWYFSRDKSRVGTGTVVHSVKTSFFYHAGSAAFGSLIIAIIKTIRAIVAYIQKRAKRMKTCKKLVQCILCVIQCLLWCVEKCMKFINKNAYIQTAIFGHSFCKAARCAFFLILRNVARIFALTLVSGFVLLIGKLVIVGGAVVACYIAIDYSGLSDDIYYMWLPPILTGVTAYYVANMFNEVWGMAMSTILQCFIADEEMYKSDKDAMYAGDSLKSTISNANKGKMKKVQPEEAVYA